MHKACILSNNTLNFYTLPELSPAFPQLNLKPLTCGWVDGLDLDQHVTSMEPGEGVVIMMCLRNKVRLVKVADRPERIRDIEFGACIAIARRGNFACVADARSYALLDVQQQQKIPLFSISSLDDQPPDRVGTSGAGGADEPSFGEPVNRPARTQSSAAGTLASRLGIHERGHGRSSSLGMFRADSTRDVSRPVSPRHDFDVPSAISRGASPRPLSLHARNSSLQDTSAGASMPPPSRPITPRPISPEKQAFTPLKPVIASPSSSEFLLTTGTEPGQPGIGMFVNLDGEVVRGTIEFATYPLQMVVDGAGVDLAASTSGGGPPDDEGHVLAVVQRTREAQNGLGIEIQRWDIDPADGPSKKEWLDLKPSAEDTQSLPQHLGIRTVTDQTQFSLSEIINLLALQPFRIDQDSTGDKDGTEATRKRLNEERKLISRLCGVSTRIVIWQDDQVSWIVRNPSVLQLNARLNLAALEETEAESRGLTGAIDVIKGLRDLKPRSELEFFSLGFIRQKAALMLYIRLLRAIIAGQTITDSIRVPAELALFESEIDPRIPLLLLPNYSDEVLHADDGIWVSGALIELINAFKLQQDSRSVKLDQSRELLQLLKRYLLSWRKKKGNPSVAEGNYVFPTVDAALLLILLKLDANSPKGPATAGSARAELNALVDGGVDCFDHAVYLLEKHQRLYVLSRLYQNKKNSASVLLTWQRIINDPTQDAGGEFVDGENELRKYLIKMRDRTLVEDYGTWLANRNPKLGVQVFADSNAKVRIEPQEALRILREKAPSAVRYFLEHLVFDKRQSQHINELIAYYLDIVVRELDNNADSRAILENTYSTYRALQPPKPTYRQFITDNATDDEWWQSRLRLLQLLGSNQGPSLSYDVPAILDRLSLYKNELVPEIIILDGRQGRHQEAIKLLVHGLGDFDTAISYCLLGGSSIFRPLNGESAIPDEQQPTREDQQKLFKYLLLEFLTIDDLSSRIERTSELLERFGAWFDVSEVLQLLPDSWSVEIFSTFLVSALRRLVRTRVETTVVKALSGSRNLKVSAEFAEKLEECGPVIQVEEGVQGSV